MATNVLTDFGPQSRAAPKDRVAVAGLWLIFFSMIFLQRFGIAGVPVSFAVAYLVLFGELPTAAQLADWQRDITTHTMVHENIKDLVDAFRHDAHPMGMFISAVAALSSFHSESSQIFDPEVRLLQIKRLIAKLENGEDMNK